MLFRVLVPFTWLLLACAGHPDTATVTISAQHPLTLRTTPELRLTGSLQPLHLQYTHRANSSDLLPAWLDGAGMRVSEAAGTALIVELALRLDKTTKQPPAPTVQSPSQCQQTHERAREEVAREG